MAKKYKISPENIHSHGDVSPQRKHDVTILFPWKKKLYQLYGIGMELDLNEHTKEAIIKKYRPRFLLPASFNLLFFQNMLSQLGYDTRFSEESLSQKDKKSKWANVYQVFYAHFSRNGEPHKWKGAPEYTDVF